ncbi:MAG TPA: hypothetical protein ENN33_15025 [Ignavibacteria bacterium]|nr:hypothetical protein [Ignavibacteria bacterium]
MPSFFHTWLPFIYLYVVGGICFFVGVLIITKSGALNFKIKRHKKWFYVILGGYFYFVFLHAFLIIAALYL